MIVAGFGFRGNATASSLQDAYDLARGAAVANLFATAADKAQSAVFRDFAMSLAIPPLGIAPAELEAQETVTRSAPSMAARRTGSVAEAAALAGAGRGARLLVARAVSRDGRATCALAEGYHQ